MISSILKFLRLKRYQYEVTFSLYMLTPTEKIIFNTFLFIFLSMLIFAVSLYLPHHMAEVVKKAWFYYTGDETMMKMYGGGQEQQQQQQQVLKEL